MARSHDYTQFSFHGGRVADPQLVAAAIQAAGEVLGRFQRRSDTPALNPAEAGGFVGLMALCILDTMYDDDANA